MSTHRRRGVRIAWALVNAILPVILAILVGALIILAIGQNPLEFFAGVWAYGVAGVNWQRSLVLMGPLLIIALGLIVVFRGQLWNLGYNGQFLLGAVVAAGLGPSLFGVMPTWLATIILLVTSVVVGAVWGLLPAILKAKYGTNEIITSLVMSFIAVGVVNLLVKGPLKNPQTPQPQTRVIDADDLLPRLFGTQINVGFLIALLLALLAFFIFKRTAFGLRLDVFGASPKAARHIGIGSTGMIILLFSISGGLIGLAGAIDVLGNTTYLRAGWNPNYGAAVLPFVFLARLSPLAVIPFIAFYSAFATGGVRAAQQAGLNADFMLVIVGLILLFMTITEFVAERRRLGQSYLPPELRTTLMQPLQRLTKRSSS